MHDLPLITTIAVAFTAAWVLGLVTQRLGLSPIVGYLLAGVAIGPHTPGFVGDIAIAHQLAEVGVILLMFGVGLHFHWRDLAAVKGVAIPGAFGQSIVAATLGWAAFSAFGMPSNSAAVVGMALAVASTVVLMRVLMDADALDSPPGHVAVGWLLVEDVITVVVLVLIPVLGGDAESQNPPAAAPTASSLGTAIGLALLKLGLLAVVVLTVGSRVVPWVLVRVAKLRSRELFTLTVLVFSVAMAAGAYAFFGASMALGAFMAGMLVSQSPVSHQAAADALPMRDAFAVLFFVSVGMVFTPSFLLNEPLMVLAALSVVLIAKPLAALAIVALLGHSVRTALTVALGLAQIGEFSFILVDLAGKHGLMPESGRNVLVATAIVSITINPYLFRNLGTVESWLRRRPRLWAMLNGAAERRAAKLNAEAGSQIAQLPERLAIVVGFGPVGRSVHQLLREAGWSPVVIDLNADAVSELVAQRLPAIYGDASHESILEQAGLGRASHLVLTLPDAGTRLAVVAAAKNLNPRARILVRAHYLGERESLEQAGAAAAVYEEAEVAIALARLVLADTGARPDAVEKKVRDLRLRLVLENVTNLNSISVASIMTPWARVRKISTASTRAEVLKEIAAERFSRWPVVDPATGRASDYLLSKDLLSNAGQEDWQRLVRPLRAISPSDDVERTLLKLQHEGGTIAVVEQGGVPVGMITLEDVLEQVVGRIEDEFPHEKSVLLVDALSRGGIVLNFSAKTSTEAIERLAAAIPGLQPADRAAVVELALARERDVSTDIGRGVAAPHARCPNLSRSVVVFGRADRGIAFSPDPAEAVRLVFLIVTPLERPDEQLALLSQIARVAANDALRERLLHVGDSAQVPELFVELSPKDDRAN